MPRELNTELPLTSTMPADMDADSNLADGDAVPYEEYPVSCRVISAGSLVGYRVRNPDGEELGKIEEILLDVSMGVIACAVLSFGGFLGMGRKLYPVPWHALTLDTGDQRFILNIDRDKLQQAPAFDENEWPNITDPQWAAEVFGYYGREPYWQNRPATRPAPSLQREG
jgi:sporulation protein YlmC with PRC-barrel domain